MTTRGGTLPAPADLRAGDGERPPTRLPLVVYVLALATFLMGTTEFVVAGLLPEIAADVQVSVAQAGLLITVFAVGMVVGAPLMSMLTLRLPRRLTLILALAVFAVGHVIVALGSRSPSETGPPATARRCDPNAGRWPRGTDCGENLQGV
ncbi:major facilitator superfamily MFS_1 [Actinobacteria bacterium OK006]|nr:major facilitator superfamily MFS_1 [Actinobacteria bacterium OK006]